jgi:hypothetical protein
MRGTPKSSHISKWRIFAVEWGMEALKWAKKAPGGSISAM